MMDTKFTMNKNNTIIPVVLMIVGAVAIAMGFSKNPTLAWASLLHSNFYFTAISLASTFFVAVNYVAQAGWSVSIKRIPEAMGGYLKFGMTFMILIFIFGHHDIYHWTHAHLYDKSSEHYDKILDGKRGFLNIPFYSVRLALYTIIWVGFTHLFRKQSLLEDANGGLDHYKRSFTYGAIFVVLFGVTSSTSAWDILMSIDAHWFSTLFGWYIFAGMFVSFFAMMCLFIVYLKSRNYMGHVNENHMHDVGKFMFAFSVFWTYLWFSQFMLIWYANLPEEVVYYKVRWENYKTLWAGNFLINFIAPFLVLMTRDAKRKLQILTIGGIIILIGHWIDVYVMVMPGIIGTNKYPGFIEIGTAMFFLGAFLLVTYKELTKAALVPKNHPMLQESLHHHI
jgi:hypothetical protein